MQPLPTLRQLQHLIALADERSFSDAAAACSVTQSTLSASIAALEDVLGQKLADRSQRRIALTPLGQEMVEKARDIVRQTETMVTRARSLDEPLTGPLRVGVIPTIAPYLLPRILPGLHKKFPKLELQLREDISSRLVDSARTGALDVILLAFPFDTPGMEQAAMYDEPFVLAARKNTWQGGKPIVASDLSGEALLLLDEGHCLRDHALAACRLQPSRQPFSATSLSTLIQMVGHGYGLTLLPQMATVDLPDAIEIIPFKGRAPSRKIGLAWRKNHPQADSFKLLKNLIAATAKPG